MIYDKHLSRHSSDASKFLSMPNTIRAAKKTSFKADVTCATILSAQTTLYAFLYLHSTTLLTFLS